jgi:hypothetical protein
MSLHVQTFLFLNARFAATQNQCTITVMNGDAPVQPASKPPESPWQYKPGTAQAAPQPTSEQLRPMVLPPEMGGSTTSHPTEATWSASEFIDHDKGFGWYVTLVSIIAALDVLVFIFIHDVVSIVALTAMGILFGIVAGRKPRVLEYKLDSGGLTIGSTFHPYAEFKSFALMDDGAFPSIMFLPLKRFMPPVSVYYEANDQQRITDVLSQYLPIEMREHDAIDRFSKRIRF